MRLIDADAFRKGLYVDKYGHISDTITRINILLERSGVDAVPVVRCKDCKYSRPKKSGIKLHCAWWYRSVEDEDFCSRGRSKDGRGD